ncbi:hypothetical protein A3D80_00225 [Candidatus Roizmanbacteria bacterium RIFCSPHIGHO2_02_FULL_40_13b]|uniref:Uncharacterized protein n=1 Tax=Candidatus Roizmanbacteria bacterium RIFCSPHIGHO2_01_FULL_39_24 TaxID=1802032 RepID=A0A1F7GKD3_9BACT|nr:MAG: hypothetical protein A2799_00495 [Candidatus Roizmanbacteria bacterium RIFCSPHIGHO2_01_FULL_39_24]OGK28061.1 MAG: hypothetical protein A3D80_00225 [Candidatus Roizmanbacteria bacterium RIFCSPHIGHO2_02_FULL_40_13b]OGK49570.1 MAG: hypothetical protein A3A56_04195 [Candidatus Roizmanbacteria bacterium RIFCSPLOWO2_01_FULL_40_32]OGK56102.1 MAG: hypothetical protein A3H83_03585 [Candidatus Roizmanbacteria bacterium RIFCSPLOWO2_02_FULL_39_8]
MNKIPLIVLAAGNGTRLRPLTATIPKPMIQFLGKPICGHTIDNALPFISEIIFVVGVHKEKIIEYFKTNYQSISVSYIDQDERKGTAHALQRASEKVEGGKFYVAYGDDIYESELFEKLSEVEEGLIGQKKENWKSFGILQTNPNRDLIKIVEKPEEFIGDFVNTGLYKFDKEIFALFDKISLSKRGEYELTDLVSSYAKTHTLIVVRVESGWYPLSFPWNILDVVEILASKIQSQNLGTVEDGAVLKGNIHIGKGTIVKAGAYIQGDFYIGENCVIGPNCFLKGFGSIGDDCIVGNATEISRSVIGSHVGINHLSYIGNSVVGNNVNLGGGTIAANLRIDGEPVRMMVNGMLINTGKKKLGTVIGDNAKTGVHTSIMPGRKIDTGAHTLPGSIIKEDVI